MFCAGFGARCVRVDKVAVLSVYINVPLSTYCKFRYVSKFTASSQGSLCISTTFLFVVVVVEVLAHTNVTLHDEWAVDK